MSYSLVAKKVGTDFVLVAEVPVVLNHCVSFIIPPQVREMLAAHPAAWGWK